jgi:hypothetical protein
MLAADASLGNVMARGWKGAKLVLSRVKDGLRGELVKRRAVAEAAREVLEEAPAVEAVPAKPAQVKAAPAKPAQVKAAPAKPAPVFARFGSVKPVEPVHVAPARDDAEALGDALPVAEDSLDTLPPVEAAGGIETARHRVASILAKLPQGVSVERRGAVRPSVAVAPAVTSRVAAESSPNLLAAWNPGGRSKASARQEERDAR